MTLSTLIATGMTAVEAKTALATASIFANSHQLTLWEVTDTVVKLARIGEPEESLVRHLRAIHAIHSGNPDTSWTVVTNRYCATVVLSK